MVNGKYSVILAACLAYGWSQPAFSAESAAPAEAVAAPVETEAAAAPVEAAAAPVEAASAPVEAAAAPVEAATAPSDETATPVVEEQASGLQFAPVFTSFGGNIGYITQRQKIGSSKYTTQLLFTTVNVKADSYIWQPWLAKVNGNLGLNASRNTSSAGSAPSSKTTSNFLTGSAALSLVPQSNFPFEAHVEKSNSQLTSGLGAVSGDYQTTRYGMTQLYRNLAGDANYMVGYDRNLWEGANSTTDKQDNWRFETSHQLFTKQSLRVNGVSTRHQRTPSNESTLSSNLVANHGYRPDAFLTVDTLANLIRTDYRLTQVENGNKSKQLSSSAYWRSAEQPLSVNGGVRLYEFGTFGSTSSQSRSDNVNLGASYELSKYTRLNGSANVNQVIGNGTRSTNSNESVGASYVPDVIGLGVYSYTRSVTVNFSNNNAPGGSGRRLTLNPAHGVNRSVALGGGTLGVNGNQALSWDKDTRAPTNVRLMHNGSLGWSRSEGQKRTMLRMNVSDSHTQSGIKDFYQLINLQASLSDHVSRDASWGGNLTIQKARTGSNISLSVTSTTTGADLNYRHQQIFGVPRLVFVSELRLYGIESVPPPLASTGQQEDNSWENRLEHSIGLLQSRLSLRVGEINSVRQTLLFFSLNRQF